MSIPPRAHRGEILLYRDGLLFRDYGDTLDTIIALGTALKAAITALAAGDILVVGPGVYSTADCTIAASNVKVIANGAVISKPSGTDYSYLLKVTGDDVLIEGISVNGNDVANIGTGYGIWVTGDRVRLKNVSAAQTNGSTINNGDGSAVKIDNCTDCDIDGLYIYHPEYTGLWLNKTPRCYINNVYCVDAQNRSLSLNSSIDLDLITISNFHAIAVTAGCSAAWNTNIDFGITLGELRMNNVTLVNDDSLNPATGGQLFKFQNIRKLVMDGVVLKHGTSVDGNSRSIMIQAQENGQDNTSPEEWIMNNVSLSGAISLGLKIGRISAIDCHFGKDDTANYVTTWYKLSADYARFERCIFDQKDNVYSLHLEENVTNADRYEFVGCHFKSDSASTTYIQPQTYAIDLTTMAGAIVLDSSNTIENVGVGELYRSNNVHGNLILTTNANGDMLFDDANMSTQKIVSFYCTTGTSSGNFTVTYSGQVTSSLAYNISAANLKIALEALSNVNLVTVTGSGTQGAPWVVTFQGKLDGINTAPTIQSVDLVGGTVSSVTNVQSAVSLGKHPQPGGGPAYFPGLDAPANGKRIWNINWTPDATQVIPEKGWISHGGAWVEMT